MDADDAVATVEAYAAALDERDLAALPRLVSPEVLGHEPTHEVVGLESFRSGVEAWLSSYSDLRIETMDLFGRDDRVAWRWRLDGMHGMTGRHVRFEGIIIFRVEQGRIAEYWGQYDRLGMLQQQGQPPVG